MSAVGLAEMTKTVRSEDHGARLSADERVLMAKADAWLDAHAEEFEETLARWVAVPSICDDRYAGIAGAAIAAGDAGGDDAVGIGRPSASTPLGPAVAQMFDIAAADMRTMGLQPSNHAGYALSAAVEDGESRADLPVGGDDEIALVSHLDVVPAGDGWTRTPFRLTREGEFVFGRGVQDCKGPSLVNLFVLRMIRELHVPMRHRVRALMGGGEETCMNDLRGYLRHERSAGFSVVTDGPFPVNYGQKGILQMVLSVPAPGIWRHFTAGSAANAVPGEAAIRLPGFAAGQVEAALAAAPSRYRKVIRWESSAGYDSRNADSDAGCAVSSVTLHAQGVAGHAAFQEGTVNAIMLLAGFLSESGLLAESGHAAELATARALFTIAKSADGRGLGISCADESGPLTFNLGKVEPDKLEPDGVDYGKAEYGKDGDMQPEDAVQSQCAAGSPGRLLLHCDSRYPVSGNGADLEAGLRAAVDAMPGVRVESLHDEPAYRIDPNSAACVTLSRAFNDFFDADKRPFTMGGGTHSRLLPQSVTFGADFWYMDDIARKVGHPGKPDGMGADEGGAHSADECVNLRNLLAAAKLYLLALARLDRVL